MLEWILLIAIVFLMCIVLYLFSFEYKFAAAPFPITDPYTVSEGNTAIQIIPNVVSTKRNPIVFIHGGAFIIGNANTSLNLGAYLSTKLQVPVYLLKYANMVDNIAMVQRLVMSSKELLGTKNFNLMGDSAGVFLGLQMLLYDSDLMKQCGSLVSFCGLLSSLSGSFLGRNIHSSMAWLVGDIDEKLEPFKNLESFTFPALLIDSSLKTSSFAEQALYWTETRKTFSSLFLYPNKPHCFIYDARDSDAQTAISYTIEWISSLPTADPTPDPTVQMEIDPPVKSNEKVPLVKSNENIPIEKPKEKVPSENIPIEKPNSEIPLAKSNEKVPLENSGPKVNPIENDPKANENDPKVKSNENIPKMNPNENGPSSKKSQIDPLLRRNEMESPLPKNSNPNESPLPKSPEVKSPEVKPSEVKPFEEKSNPQENSNSKSTEEKSNQTVKKSLAETNPSPEEKPNKTVKKSLAENNPSPPEPLVQSKQIENKTVKKSLAETNPSPPEPLVKNNPGPSESSVKNNPSSPEPLVKNNPNVPTVSTEKPQESPLENKAKPEENSISNLQEKANGENNSPKLVSNPQENNPPKLVPNPQEKPNVENNPPKLVSRKSLTKIHPHHSPGNLEIIAKLPLEIQAKLAAADPNIPAPYIPPHLKRPRLEDVISKKVPIQVPVKNSEFGPEEIVIKPVTLPENDSKSGESYLSAPNAKKQRKNPLLPPF